MKKESLDLLVAIVCVVLTIAILGIIGYWLSFIHWSVTVLFLAISCLYILYKAYIEDEVKKYNPYED